MIPFPNKKYQIIYADPPWSYRDKASAGNRGAIYKYDVLDNNYLCNLPIENISEDNCALFLWVTMPMLQEGLNLMKAWGFTYKTVGFIWVKRNKKAATWFWGMGNYTRSNPELCLLAFKGKLKRQSASIHSIIESPIEEHSKKPAIVRNKIVELFGDLPRIELFARQTTPGWDVWGNEVEVTAA